MAFTALFDANVLYKAQLRDLLMELALTDLFRAKWTNEILDEWIENLLKNRPDLDRDRLSKTRAMMNLHVRDCLVEGYQDFIEKIKLKDPNDRHVVAAAIVGRADLIVTFNTKDFDEQVLKQYKIQAQHPDDFLVHLYSLAPQMVIEAVSIVRKRLQKPRVSSDEYLKKLEEIGLKDFASSLKNHLKEI